MISGLQKISVYDPATGTVVQLNNVAPSASFKNREPLSVKNTDSELIYDGDDSYLEFAAFDNGAFDQLETWMKAGTGLNIVGMGVEEHFAWYETTPIVVKKNFGFQVGNRNSIVVSTQKSRGSHNINARTNLLRFLGKWEDADTNNKADLMDFTIPGTVVWDNTNKRQSIQQATGIYASGTVAFPIAGAKFYCAPNFQSGGTDYYMKFLSSGASVLSTVTGTGFNPSLNGVSPAGTYYVSFIILNSSATATIFNLPFLGVYLNKGFSNINY